mmetsp:Transcript_11856/g.13208  ORF Transcript_11856/g.13208 Transcript_11856/m.13208 type:complete len:316 (+) Transcript_11856:323-1270(+)
MFFEWLDSKGEAAGWEKPDLPECPRSVLDSDLVRYITKAEDQQQYLLKFVPMEEERTSASASASTSTDNGGNSNGSIHSPTLTSTSMSTSMSTSTSPPLPSPRSNCIKLVDCNGKTVRTGPTGWIFILRDHELYATEKIAQSNGNVKFRFHHSSFFGGKAVAAAGILITDDNGQLRRVYPHSGHYRPGEAHMQRMLYHLYQVCGLDLSTFEVDMQQIMHVSRDIRDARTPKGGRLVVESNKSTKKAKKTDSLYLKNATFVALFLAHKAKVIRIGLLSKIHKVRSVLASQRTPRNVLNAIDDGGYWPQRQRIVKHK